MSRPFRRYCFHLSIRLGVYIDDLQNTLNSRQVMEYMAFDKTNDSDWIKKWEKEQELKKSAEMAPSEKAELFKSLFRSMGKK